MRNPHDLGFIELSTGGDRARLLPILKVVEAFERIQPIRTLCVMLAVALGAATWALAAFPTLFSEGWRHLVILAHGAALAGLVVAGGREWLLRRRVGELASCKTHDPVAADLAGCKAARP